MIDYVTLPAILLLGTLLFWGIAADVNRRKRNRLRRLR